MTQQQLVATIVVPTRHEEGSVGPLLERLHHAFADRHGHVEVLFVDDSDNAGTVTAIQRSAHTLRSHKLVINHYHRTGPERWGRLSGAVIDGIERALSPYVLVMDGDGQHPPETAPEMIEKVRNGSDIVVASRYREGGSSDGLDGIGRKLVSRSATVLTRLLFPQGLRGVTDPMTGFFAIKKSQLNLEVLKAASGFKILLEILARHPHLKRAEVPLQFQERLDGVSKAGEGNGVEFIKQLPRLRAATMPTFLNFALGGGLIAIVGALMLWGLVHLGVQPVVANTIQLAVTLVLNFIYNKKVTWAGHTNGTLRRQMVAFGVTRSLTLGLSWIGFVGLMAAGSYYHLLGVAWRAQAANAVCLVGSTLLNFVFTKMVFEQRRSAARHRRRSRFTLGLGVMSALVGMMMVTIGWAGFTIWLTGFTLMYALFGLATASLEMRWRIYGRRTPEARQAMRFPPAVEPEEARLRFSILVPALDEPDVIQGTLRRLLGQTHPNVQIIATLVTTDRETIAQVLPLVDEFGESRIKLVTNTYKKGSKANQLNYALGFCDGDYVGVVDAETVEPEQLLVHVEAVIRQTGADVVQGGVQLMNLDVPKHQSWDRLAWFPIAQRALRPFFMSGLWARCRGWFAVHNVMEYFFWWSSRVFYQVDQGFVPLGGNTLFIRRDLLVEAGGWPDNLTEDCKLGVHLSVNYGAKIVAAYQPELAAREETPPRVFGPGGLDRQRRRWVQGFLSVLLEWEWRKLPTFHQRFMALYILAMPFVQAVNGVLLPLAILGVLLLKAPVGLVLIMFLPFIPMLMSMVVQVVGLREFSREFGVKAKPRHYLSLVGLTFVYQLVLAWSAMVAVKRHIAGEQNWYKTRHPGAHMQATPAAVVTEPAMAV